MSKKSISIVSIAILVAAMAWKISEDRAPQTQVSRLSLYEGLNKQLNEIGRIEVRSLTDESVLVRDGETWELESRDGYPAAFTKIKRAILQIADLAIVEAKTSLSENYQRIGVQDPEMDAATGTLVSLATNTGDEIASLIVGNENNTGSEEQYFVRKKGDAQSWLVSGDLDFSAKPLEWVDMAIADISTERVRQVTIQRDDSAEIVISKEEPKQNYFKLSNIPDGFKTKSRSTVSSIGAIMLNLNFNDVTSARYFADVQPRKKLELRTFDGLIAILEEFDHNDKVFGRFTFSYDPAVIILQENESETPDNFVETRGRDETVEQEAARLGKRTSSWAYELPGYKVRSIDRPFDELIEKIETDSK